MRKDDIVVCINDTTPDFDDVNYRKITGIKVGDKFTINDTSTDMRSSDDSKILHFKEKGGWHNAEFFEFDGRDRAKLKRELKYPLPTSEADKEIELIMFDGTIRTVFGLLCDSRDYESRYEQMLFEALFNKIREQDEEIKKLKLSFPVQDYIFSGGI